MLMRYVTVAVHNKAVIIITLSKLHVMFTNSVSGQGQLTIGTPYHLPGNIILDIDSTDSFELAANSFLLHLADLQTHCLF